MSFTIKGEPKENRMYITIDGVFTQEDVQPFRNKIKSESSKLKKGWTCLQDLREFKILDQNVAQQCEENKKIAEDLGVSKSAMIVKSAILKGQMNRTFNQDATVMEKFFDNIEDGVKYLNS